MSREFQNGCSNKFTNGQKNFNFLLTFCLQWRIYMFLYNLQLWTFFMTVYAILIWQIWTIKGEMQSQYFYCPLDAQLILWKCAKLHEAFHSLQFLSSMTYFEQFCKKGFAIRDTAVVNLSSVIKCVCTWDFFPKEVHSGTDYKNQPKWNIYSNIKRYYFPLSPMLLKSQNLVCWLCWRPYKRRITYCRNGILLHPLHICNSVYWNLHK